MLEPHLKLKALYKETMRHQLQALHPSINTLRTKIKVVALHQIILQGNAAQWDLVLLEPSGRSALRVLAQPAQHQKSLPDMDGPCMSTHDSFKCCIFLSQREQETLFAELGDSIAVHAIRMLYKLQWYLDKRNGVCSMKIVPLGWKFPFSGWISMENDFWFPESVPIRRKFPLKSVPLEVFPSSGSYCESYTTQTLLCAVAFNTGMHVKPLSASRPCRSLAGCEWSCMVRPIKPEDLLADAAARIQIASGTTLLAERMPAPA